MERSDKMEENEEWFEIPKETKDGIYELRMKLVEEIEKEMDRHTQMIADLLRIESCILEVDIKRLTIEF